MTFPQEQPGPDEHLLGEVGDRCGHSRRVRHHVEVPAVQYPGRRAQFARFPAPVYPATCGHEVAQAAAPEARIVYVDNDPIVHVHANALLTGSGHTRIVLADLREPDQILAHPKTRDLIDFTQPVALLLVAILHFIADDEDPAGLVAVLRDALPPGSYLGLSHATNDFRTETAQVAAAVYDKATSRATLRSHAQIAAFFGDWDLVPPGLVQVPLWRPDGPPPRPRDLQRMWIYGGVARRAG